MRGTSPSTGRWFQRAVTDYFLPDRRSINEANFEPFLSILTRKWRTPVSPALSLVISSVWRRESPASGRASPRRPSRGHRAWRRAGPACVTWRQGLRVPAGVAAAAAWRWSRRLLRCRLAESWRRFTVHVLMDVLWRVVLEQLEDAAGAGGRDRFGRRCRNFPDVRGVVDAAARCVEICGALFLDGRHRDDGHGLEVGAHVVRHLLRRDGVAEEAESQAIPHPSLAMRFGGVQRIGVENRQRRHLRHVELRHRPVELHGEQHRRIALDVALDGLHRLRVFGLDDTNRFVDVGLARAFPVWGVALEQADGLRIGKIVELVDGLANAVERRRGRHGRQLHGRLRRGRLGDGSGRLPGHEPGLPGAQRARREPSERTGCRAGADTCAAILGPRPAPSPAWVARPPASQAQRVSVPQPWVPQAWVPQPWRERPASAQPDARRAWPARSWAPQPSVAG